MRIKKDALEHIVAHAEMDAPVEACGYLFGSADVVEWALAVANVEDREDHFTFDPQEQYEAYERSARLGIEIVGIYHSHPSTPAVPSAEDIRLALDPGLLHLIISLMGGEKRAKAFWIRKGEVEEEPLILEGYSRDFG